MKRSFIIVTEVSENSLTNGLMNFANQYSAQPFVSDILLSKEKGKEKFLILFSNTPSFDHFCYTVNYIHYIKTPNKSMPTAFGYYLNFENESKNSFLTSGFVKTYVSKNDTKYDNVNVVNSKNETFLFDFGGRHKKLSVIEESFEVPEINIDDYNHVLNIVPFPEEDKPWWQLL